MIPAVITLDREVPDETADLLLDVFEEAGLDAELGPPHVRMGSALDAVAQLIVQTPLEAAVGALTTAAGAALWKRLGPLLRRRGAAEAEPPRGDRITILVIDPRTGDRLELDSRSPLDAGAAARLADLLRELPGERPPVELVYDPGTGVWRMR